MPNVGLEISLYETLILGQTLIQIGPDIYVQTYIYIYIYIMYTYKDSTTLQSKSTNLKQYTPQLGTA